MFSSRRPQSRQAGVLAAALVGAATGLRSSMGLAGVVLGTDPNRLPGPLRTGRARVAATVAALTEVAADKRPDAPDRTAPAGLAARIVFGALAGGLAARSRRTSVVAGTVTAAGAAVGAAYGGMALRARLSRRFPPLAVALGEDALAVGLAGLGVRRSPPR
jgi:uncharacterized membrane protein